MNYFPTLSSDISPQIFLYLPLPSLLKNEVVCKEFQKIQNNCSLIWEKQSKIYKRESCATKEKFRWIHLPFGNFDFFKLNATLCNNSTEDECYIFCKEVTAYLPEEYYIQVPANLLYSFFGQKTQDEVKVYQSSGGYFQSEDDQKIEDLKRSFKKIRLDLTYNTTYQK